MMRRLRLGISTCPNDTFAFHALIARRIETPGIEFDFRFLDVEQLNEGLFRGEFDVAKASFHAALHLSDRYGVFRSGSALGLGNGPLLLASQEFARRWLESASLDADDLLHRHVAERSPLFDVEPALRESASPTGARTLCPGKYTTATFLLRTTFPGLPQPGQVVFSEIMPALADGSADLGVCIHEGRFTWHEQKLACLADLGTLWHARTRMPLPLGGILGRLDLPAETLASVGIAIRRSIEYGHAHRDETMTSMRPFAQELSDAVIWSHVDLYVNDATLDLGDAGERALETMGRLAVDAGLLATDRPSLSVFR